MVYCESADISDILVVKQLIHSREFTVILVLYLCLEMLRGQISEHECSEHTNL